MVKKEGGRILKLFLTKIVLSSIFASTTSTLAAIRSIFYFPAEKFCAVYQGNINSAKQFVLLLEHENQLTIQANSDLSIAVTRQGKVIPPYQVNSANDTLVSKHSYRMAMMGEHIIWVKGSASEAKITLCLR